MKSFSRAVKSGLSHLTGPAHRGRKNERTSRSRSDSASSSSPARDQHERALKKEATQPPQEFDLHGKTPTNTAKEWLDIQPRLAQMSQELLAMNTEFGAVNKTLANAVGFTCTGQTPEDQPGHAQAQQALGDALVRFKQILSIEAPSGTSNEFSVFGTYYEQMEALRDGLGKFQQANQSLLGYSAPGMAQLNGLIKKLDAHMQRFVQCAQPLKAEIERTGFHIDAQRIGPKT